MLQIRSRSGLKKGVRLGLAVIACVLPTRVRAITSLNTFLTVLLTIGQTFLFFTILGLAFDYRASRTINDDRFE